MFCNTFRSIQHNTDLTGLKAFMLYKKLLVGKIRKRRNQKKIPTPGYPYVQQK